MPIIPMYVDMTNYEKCNHLIKSPQKMPKFNDKVCRHNRNTTLIILDPVKMRAIDEVKTNEILSALIVHIQMHHLNRFSAK